MTPIEHYEQLSLDTMAKEYPITAETTPARYWDLKWKFPPQRKAGDLEKVIKKFTEMLGFQCSKITTSGTYVKGTKVIGVSTSLGTTKSGDTGHYIPGGSTKGVADLVLTIYGLKLDCEIKFSKGDRQRKTQIAYQAMVEKAGGFYMIAHSFEDFYEQFYDFLELPQVRLMKEYFDNNK